MEIICDEGAPANAILKLAKEKWVDFNIVGMRGDETRDMIFHTKIPLLILPKSNTHSHHSLKKENTNVSPVLI